MTRLEEILPLLCGEVVCVADGEEKAFQSREALEKSELYENYTVDAISVREGKLLLSLTPWQIPATDTDSAWAKGYKETNGVEPGFF